jgi:hypothetical protein
MYLLCTSQELQLWVSRNAMPELVAQVFGSADNVPDGPVRMGVVVVVLYVSLVCRPSVACSEQASLPKVDTPLSLKVRNIVNGLRNCHPRFLRLLVVRDGGPRRNEFLQHMVGSISSFLLKTLIVS